MAEIPVERKTKGGFPWWLIPLILLLLLLPLIWYCSRNAAVVDNTNTNRAAMTANANGNRMTNANSSAMTTTANTSGNTAVVFNEDERIRAANERASEAMAKYYPNGTPQQVIEALNYSAVNFAKGDATIPAPNLALLKQAGEQLKKAPADTRIQIDGYTDNDGEPAANQQLSQRRAEAVRSALLKEGVPAVMLSTKGFGETNPKASNDTPEGRFENRRIEYKVATSNTTTQQVAPNSNGGK